MKSPIEQRPSNLELTLPASEREYLPETPKQQSVFSRRGMNIDDADLITRLDQYSIEDVVELKISRFFDQIGTFYPDEVYELIMSKVEKPLLVQILRRVGGNQVQAAKILGINRNTLRKKIKQYGL